MELSVVVVADGEPAPPKDLRADLAERVSQIAILCNDATLDPPTGDPIDIALLEAFGGPRAQTLLLMCLASPASPSTPRAGG